MRCEKVYRRFIPRLRGDASPDGRGRGKGCAGLLLLPGDATEVEVRGMEAVRSDSTPLARRFQVERFRSVTQRSEKKRGLPWKALLARICDALVAATAETLAGLRVREVAAAAR